MSEKTTRGGSWRSQIVRFDEKKANEWMAKNTGKRLDPDQRPGARYFPKLETTKLSPDDYPGNYILVRILPGLASNPCPNWIFTVQEYYLGKFVDVLKRSNVPEKHLEVFSGGRIHSPATMNPAKEREDPLNALRSAAYQDNSDHCRLWAKNLFPKPRHFMNCIARMLPLLDQNDKLVNHRNVGPRVLRLPDDVVKKIMMAFKNPEIGDPTDLDEAYDFKYWMERRKVPIGDSEVLMPQYDHCEFARKPSRAGSEEELEKWMTNLPNLHEEYTETSMKDLAQIADLCEMVVFNRIKIVHPVGGNGNDDGDDDRPSDETEASDASGRPVAKASKEEEAPRARRRPEPEEEEAPRARRRPEPEEEEAPRARRRPEPEEEEAPRARRRPEPEEEEAPRARRRPEPEEEEAPRARRRPEPEEEEAPRARRRPEPEEEEEAPRARRRPEPEEEEAPRKPRARVQEDDDGNDDKDDWLDKKLADMEK